MIIGVSGKIGSGKDIVGNIIQYLTHKDYKDDKPSYYNYSDFLYRCDSRSHPIEHIFTIHKFADALKDIVCILTGCTREQLEDIDFKNSKLPNEWIRYGYADGFIKIYEGDGKMGQPVMNNKQCDKERYEIELKTNWQTAYKAHLTYRELLQYLGTDLLRNQLHENVWVNALFSKYYVTHYIYADTIYVLQPNGTYRLNDLNHSGMLEQDMINLKATKVNACNWIITDVRFPNEANAIKERGGIIIRVNRNEGCKPCSMIPLYKCNECEYSTQSKHPSETALDNYTFDEVIDNNGTIEELIVKLKEILIKHKIL